MVGLFAGLIFVPTAAVAAVGGIQYLNSNDPKTSTVVQGLTSEFPLPPGASYSLLLKRYPTKEKGFVQRTNLAQDVAYYAHCAWYEHWLNGNAKQRAADQPTIDAIPTWKYWHFAIDDTTGKNPGLDLLKGIAAETRVGTTTMISQYVTANCLGRSPQMQSPGPSPKS